MQFFFDPCFFNLLFTHKGSDYSVTTEYHLLEDDEKLKWIKFNSVLTKNELEDLNDRLKQYAHMFPFRK